jgi:VCBS repeat-containing protein
LLDNDNDAEGESLTAVLDTDISHGALTLNGDGSFAYTPNVDYCGTDSFCYHAYDGESSSNVATVALSVTCIDDAPVANSDLYTTTEDISLNVPAPGLLDNDNEVDGESLTAVLDTEPVTGTLQLNANGSFIYTPMPGYVGTVTFTYVAHDGTAPSAPAMVAITVSAVSDFKVFLPMVLSR